MKTTKKKGRRSKRDDPKRIRKFLDYLSIGQTYKVCCAHAGFSWDSYQRALEDNYEFKELLTEEDRQDGLSAHFADLCARAVAKAEAALVAAAHRSAYGQPAKKTIHKAIKMKDVHADGSTTERIEIHPEVHEWHEQSPEMIQFLLQARHGWKTRTDVTTNDLPIKAIIGINMEDI